MGVVLAVSVLLLVLFESVVLVVPAVLTAVSPPMLLLVESLVAPEPPRKSVTYQPEPFS